MRYAVSASATCSASASASEYTAIVRMPSRRQVRKMRTAISPRLATRTLVIGLVIAWRLGPPLMPLPLGEAARSAGEGCVRGSNVREDTHPSPQPSPRGRGSYASVFDLTLKIDEHMPVWPGDPRPVHAWLQRIDRGDPVDVSQWTLGSHTGT